MKKYERLKKKLIKEILISAAICATLGGGVFALLMLLDGVEQQQRTLTASLHTLSAQIAEEEKKIGIVRSSIDEFNVLKSKLDTGELSINRSKAEEVLTKLQKKYRTTAFQATVAAETPLLGDGYDNKMIQITQSDILLTFSAMSDVHVFSLLSELTQTLPGYFRISSFSITRDGRLKSDDMIAMSQGKTPELVKAKIGLVWLGLRLPEKPKSDQQKAAAAPAAVGGDD